MVLTAVSGFCCNSFICHLLCSLRVSVSYHPYGLMLEMQRARVTGKVRRARCVQRCVVDQSLGAAIALPFEKLLPCQTFPAPPAFQYVIGP